MARWLLLIAALLALAVPSVADAQLLLRGAGTPATAGGGGLVLTYQNHAAGINGQTSPFTVTSAALGPASADREIFIAITANWGTGQTITTATTTVGGVNVTCPVTTASGTKSVTLCYAPVPTGTTGNIVINASASWSRVQVDWWSLTGTTKTNEYSSTGATAVVTGTTTSIALPLTTAGAGGGTGIPAGGVAIAVTQMGNTTFSANSVGATNGTCTIRDDTLVGTSFQTTVCDNATAGTPQTFTFSGNNTVWRGGAIAWAP